MHFDTLHEVVGVDVSTTKIDLINNGKSPIVEPGLEPLLEQGIRTGRLSGTTDFKKAVLDTDVSFICVGTPSACAPMAPASGCCA